MKAAHRGAKRGIQWRFDMSDDPQEILDPRLMKIANSTAEQIAAELNEPVSVGEVEQITLIIYGALVEVAPPEQ